MKKRTVLLVALLVMVMVGCGKKNDTSDVEKLTQEYRDSITKTLQGVGGPDVPDGAARGDINKDDVEFAKSGEKGTLDNPYSIGDEIHITGIFGSGDLIATNLALDFKVDAIVTPDEYADYGIVPNQSDYIELLRYQYKVSGDIAGSVDHYTLPRVGLLSDKKVEWISSFFTEDFDPLYTLYADNEYTLWSQGDKDAKYEYAFVRVVTENGQRTIFVKLN